MFPFKIPANFRNHMISKYRSYADHLWTNIVNLISSILKRLRSNDLNLSISESSQITIVQTIHENKHTDKFYSNFFEQFNKICLSPSSCINASLNTHRNKITLPLFKINTSNTIQNYVLCVSFWDFYFLLY